LGKPKPRLVAGLAMLTAVLLLGAACADDPEDGAGDRPQRPEPTLTDEPPALKPALAGLVVIEPRALATVPYADFGTITTTWKEVEPDRGTFDFDAVDAVLDEHPDVRFRLRIRTGRDAPYWLKQATGGCITVHPSTANGAKGCIAQFWHPRFLHHFEVLMNEVARRYEEDPRVVDVANSACSTAYAEPFILGVDAASLVLLEEAGLTKAKHEDCIAGSTEAMMASFGRTRISLSGHGAWETTRGSSWTAERDLLNRLRARYPYRLVLEDHGLGPDDDVCIAPGEPAETAESWHCYLAGLAPEDTPHGWQLTLNDGSMSDAVWAGVRMGACYLEYAAFQQLSEDERRKVHDALLENCAS
jgi:hypothetical protein